MKTERQLVKEGRQGSKEGLLDYLWGLTVIGIMGCNQQTVSGDVSLGHSACFASDYTARVYLTLQRRHAAVKQK